MKELGYGSRGQVKRRVAIKGDFVVNELVSGVAADSGNLRVKMINTM
jgi:hypothetical protein